jgi:hypothetical protein
MALSIVPHVETAVALRALDAREEWKAASRRVRDHIIGAPAWSGCPQCNRGGRVCAERVELDDAEHVAWVAHEALRGREGTP